jgi:ATP-dependent Clp protease protease subunit
VRLPIPPRPHVWLREPYRLRNQWANVAYLAPPRRGSATSNSAASLTPMSLESTLPPITASGGFDPTSDVYNKLLKNRIVMLGSEVNSQIANLICAQLLHLEGEDDEKDIWLYINSPGGSVTDGLAIYDTMNFIKPQVGTICLGLAASMGQFLLCAGAPGKRYALPSARIMMHQPSGGFQGQAADIKIQAEQMIYIKQVLAERIAEHTGQTVEQIHIDSDRDRWFTAQQAKDYGIIDAVIDRRGEMGK